MTEKQKAYYDRMRETDGYRRLGKLGGQRNVAKHGSEHMSQLGQKGYQGLVKSLGGEDKVKSHLSALGKKGKRKGASYE